MRSLLSVGVQMLATVTGAYLFLGKHLRPRTAADPCPPLGFVQAFFSCSRCAAIRPHLVHSSSCRTCQTCGHTTYPGDTQ